MMNCVLLFRKSFVYFDEEEGKKGCISRITERALKRRRLCSSSKLATPACKNTLILDFPKGSRSSE